MINNKRAAGLCEGSGVLAMSGTALNRILPSFAILQASSFQIAHILNRKCLNLRGEG
jgi:hypothetical protein